MTRLEKWAIVAACVAVGILVLVWVRPFQDRNDAAPGAATAPLFQSQDPPMTVLVFYATPEGVLESEERTIFQSALRINQMKQAVLEGLKPPQDPSHLSVIPEGVTLREVYVDRQNTAYVDVSQEWVSKHPGGSAYEWLTVQAMVAGVMKNFEEIRGVRFLVEGQPVETLGGHLDLSQPMTMDLNFIRVVAAPSPVVPPAP